MKWKEVISLILLGNFLFLFIFFTSEGELVKAANQTATDVPTSTLAFSATLTVSEEISLICPDAVALSAIAGLTGGSSSNTADCNVKTNSADGYTLYIHTSTTPALKSGSLFFSDYSTTTPEYTWALTSTASSSFGFSASSTDIVTAFKTNGSACGTGTTSTYNQCFRAFSGTTDVSLANKTSPTAVAGTTTTINFKAQVGTTAVQTSGSYSAGITITAVTQ